MVEVTLIRDDGDPRPLVEGEAVLCRPKQGSALSARFSNAIFIVTCEAIMSFNAVRSDCEVWIDPASHQKLLNDLVAVAKGDGVTLIQD